MRENFVGSWELLSWELVDQQGNKHFPYGEDARGYLIYLDSGLMSVHLMQNNRELFQSQTVLDVTAAEALQSYKTYVSYCGRYEFHDDSVWHYVEMHTCPNWIGSIQKRQFELRDAKLYLSHKLEDHESYLVWKKV